jgi:hypothetical protein
MPLPENCCSTLFTTGYKRLTEGGCQAFALRLLLFGFLMGKAFGLRLLGFLGFWCGRLLEGKKIEGRETAKGELLKRG